MLIAATFLASLALAPTDLPDLIVLKDGKEIECRVLYEDDDTVTYTKKRKGVEVERSEVESIQSIERSMREFLEAYKEIQQDDVAALLDLASFCESRELAAEARIMWIRTLLFDPVNETAWTKLGGVYSKRRGWRLKVRGRFYKLEDLRERVSDWKNALELPTAHFLIKTDIEPSTALNIAIDVERAYMTFYDLLGEALHLYPFDETPEIYIYANEKNYEKPPVPGDIVWFAPLANILHVNGAASKQSPHTVVAKLTEALIFNSFRRTVGKTGSIAPWAQKGIAQAFGGAYRRDPGRASWEIGQPLMSYFEEHASDEKPLKLKEILRSGRGAYNDGTNAMKYTAQSYTLVHFLANADGGAMRDRFAEFLISSYRGQGAATHFEKIMGMKMEELEPLWIAYVREVAGA